LTGVDFVLYIKLVPKRFVSWVRPLGPANAPAGA